MTDIGESKLKLFAVTHFYGEKLEKWKEVTVVNFEVFLCNIISHSECLEYKEVQGLQNRKKKLQSHNSYVQIPNVYCRGKKYNRSSWTPWHSP
jgi:hypothetical protein